MRKLSLIMAGLFALGLFLATLGCGAGNSKTVRAADYGDAWPLTVSEAKLVCEGPYAVFLKVDDRYYGVNGMGRNYVNDRYLTDSYPLESIWLHDPRAQDSRINISPLLDDGLVLCD